MSYLKEIERMMNEMELEYISGEEELDYDDVDLAYQIAKDNGIAILSDKEINTIAKDGNEVVAGLWTSWDNNEFSFDVAVRKDYQQKGIGSELVDMAIDNFNWESEAYGDDAILKTDVVSPKMEKILLKKGFEIEDKIGGHVIMVRK